MGRKIEISWENATASEISVAKRCAPTQRGFVRFHSFEFLRAGYLQGEVARLSGRAVRTIRRWMKMGPRVPYLGYHIRHHVVGAVNPASGEFFSLVVRHSDCFVFPTFFDELAKHTAGASKRRKIILVLDNASWHKHSNLNWHHITPCYLPAYSPDFYPIEAIWRVLKERFFNGWIAKTPEQLIERIYLAIRYCLSRRFASGE